MNTSPRETEQFWHQCILITILVIAACARFYALDQGSLTADGLRNLGACDSSGWLAMAMDYSNSSGMTPLYPTLLCQITDWTSRTEFFVRLLSALAGLATMFFLYITGRDFVSPTAGLLAAAMAAAKYQSIYIDRETSLYSLLLLTCLVHNYCFCRLFFSHNRYNLRPFIIGHQSSTINFQWSWRPGFPADARCLMGFWISGALAFYTSPMALIQLTSEVLASAFLIKNAADIFPNWRAGMRSLWLPLGIALLPWLPIFYRYRSWVLEGNLFDLQSATTLWQQVSDVLPRNPDLQYVLVAQLALFLLLLAVLKLLKKPYPRANHFYRFILFQAGFAIISLWLLPIASYLSYIYYWMVFVLLLLIPASISIDLIPSRWLKMGTIASIVGFMLIMQVKFNADHKLYLIEKSGDFRLAAKIIHDDQEFMKTHRDIVMSSKLFKHHLDADDIPTTNITLFDSADTPENLTAPELVPEFYYLEYAPYDREVANETTAFQALSSQYKKLCMTKIPWIRIVKFSRDPAAADQGGLDCRTHLSGVKSL